MSSGGWRETTLGEICSHEGTVQTGPFGSQLHAEDYSADGIPVIMPVNIGQNRIDESGIARVSQDHVARLSRHKVRVGDIVYSRRGDITRRALIRQHEAGWLCGTGCLLVRSGSAADPIWLSYWLGTPFVHEWLIQRAVGATMPNLNTGILAELPVTLPPIREQRRIAGALGAMDHLIEVNRGLVRDLDASVRLLGLETLAKAQGRPLVPFTEIADVVKGYSYKSSELTPGDGWLVNLKNIGRSGTFEARGFKPLTATVKPHQVVDNGDVLVAQTDLTQDREVIARPVRVRKGTLEGRLVASLDLAIVRPKAPHTRESIFAILNTEDFRSHALGYCNGTTVLHMGARALPDYFAPSLTDDEIDDLTARVRPLREAADALSIEISELEATRDELLPLLMSGRVRVTEEVVA